MSRSVIVVGAGAAGLTAAIFAARGGARVHLLERTADGGRKILISGGGRCNVLPSRLAPERFVTDSAKGTLRRLLRSWPLDAQRAFFEQDLGVPLRLEEATGKLFPSSNRARDVRDALVNHARMIGVTLEFNCFAQSISRVEDGWVLQTANGSRRAEHVVLAAGGLSVPSTGSDGSGLAMAASLGLRLNTTYAALTPLVAQPPIHASLSGVSLPVRLRARAHSTTVEASGGFLFTHRGYSGPSVLDVSHLPVRHRDAAVRVQWTDISAAAWSELLTAAGGPVVATVLNARLPQRLGAQLLIESGVPEGRRTSDLRRAERVALVERLTSYRLPWTGDEGFRVAEVTGGGVALEELDARTLQSRHHPGLFVCGEMLDAFGPIGGHNFAWAWATGRLAGLAAASPGPAGLQTGRRTPADDIQ